MLEAQEMFRTSNKVTRPEKALILGFMAGSRGKMKISFYRFPSLEFVPNFYLIFLV